MLTHIVCFKYRPEVDEGQRQVHRELLRQLARIPGVLHLKSGADVVRSGRSYDTGLVIAFESRSALERYVADPAHVPVATRGTELCESIVAVDFED